MSANVCGVKRSFKQYQNEHNSLKDTGEKGKKPCNIDPKIAMKILFYYPLPLNSSNPKILKAFLKTFPSKMKPTKCPTKEKKMRQKRREERKQRVKIETAVSFLNLKTRKFAFCACPNFTS